jgi:catechol 2,3-dioxygenase-like lactoylglutathione lyase family enzyme
VLYDGQTTRPIAHSEGDFWSEYDVSGSNVVWTDMVAGERQVFLYDGHTTKQISQNPPCGDTGDAPPRIDGNRVVWDWHGTVGDNADTYYVYYYDGTDLRRLARDPDAWDAGDYRPFVSGSNVAWSAWIHGPIMFYDGSNVVEFPADGEVLALSGSSILFSRGGVVLATATPEPSTMALLAAGGACAAVLAWRRRARHRAAQVMRRTKRQAAPGRPAGTTRRAAFALSAVLAAALSAVPGRAVEWTMTEFFWDPQHWEHIRGGGPAKLEGTSAVWRTQGGTQMYYDGTRLWNLNALAGATSVYDADLSGGKVVFKAQMWPGVEYFDRIYQFSGGRLSILAEGPHGYWGSLGNPRISGSNIVWTAGTPISYPDLWNRAIYEYDGHQPMQIAPPQPWGRGIDSHLGQPLISGSNVVWSQWTSESGGDLLLYDGQTTRTIAHRAYDFWPDYALSGSNVVWTDMVGGDRQIFLYDGQTTTQISQNPPGGDTGDYPPRIDGNRVVWDWHGTVGDNADTYYVYYYDDTGLGRLARDPSGEDPSDCRPFVSGRNVAWSAWENGPIMFYDGSNIVELPCSGDVLAVSGHNILFSRGGAIALATATPEPGTVALFAAGSALLAVLAWVRRMRERNND